MCVGRGGSRSGSREDLGGTSASSLACSMTFTLCPNDAHDMAAAIPLSPAPTIVISRRSLSGIWSDIVSDLACGRDIL